MLPVPGGAAVAVPAVARQGTASQVQLAAQMLEILVKAFPEREVHCTGRRVPRESLVIKRTTCTTQLPSSAVISGPKPPPTAQRGGLGDRRPDPHLQVRRRHRVLAVRDRPDLPQEQRVQAAAWPRLWYGSFKCTPGQLVLMREPYSKKPYDLRIFTLDTSLSPVEAIERYSWRWPIEPSNAVRKQVICACDACNRTASAVERAVPFAFLVQSLTITWYAISCDPAACLEQRLQRSPWYRAKATPAAAVMHTALRDALT